MFYTGNIWRSGRSQVYFTANVLVLLENIFLDNDCSSLTW